MRKLKEGETEAERVFCGIFFFVGRGQRAHGKEKEEEDSSQHLVIFLIINDRYSIDIC